MRQIVEAVPALDVLDVDHFRNGIEQGGEEVIGAEGLQAAESWRCIPVGWQRIRCRLRRMIYVVVLRHSKHKNNTPNGLI